ncbi:MAG: KilA-N domain-containing protein [Desulfurivibrio sp.]|nr:KilA-N domain-containing protein [Desulfurivibrio sp.]
MRKNRDIEVLDTRVTISRMAEEDYISLTDIARHRDKDRSDDLIRNWVRNRNTLEFLGIWEQIHNPAFNSVEFDGFRMQAGLNSFTLTPKHWIERTNARGSSPNRHRTDGDFDQ